MTRQPQLSLIAIVARNGAIGRGNALLVHLPEDLKHFKRTTLGCPVIMGRKTWDSLPARAKPLPGRTNIVVTRNAQWQAEGALRAASLQDALAQLGDTPKAYVIGGAQLYAAALPLADELVLTEIDRDFSDADAWFPSWDKHAFNEVTREHHHAPAPLDLDYAFITYQRKH